MAAPLGNQFWKMAATPGRPRKFESPEQLWGLCCEYFQWVEENPLMESRPFAYMGEVVQEPVAKMRAMTLNGLCLYLGIGDSTWKDYKKRDEYSEVISQCENIIYEQKFTGAAADLLNANIISRDLGLADKKDISSSDGTMTPKPAIDATKLSDSALREIVAAQSKDADS